MGLSDKFNKILFSKGVAFTLKEVDSNGDSLTSIQMENQRKGSKKLWKPPSFEDFNVDTQCKRIKLDEVRLGSTKGVEVASVIEPKSVEDLATHPKKIEELKSWFDKTGSLKAPILLITGPAGSGKTVTLKLVTSSLNLSIKEWINPIDKADFKSEFVPVDKSDFSDSRQIDKFEDFIFRSSRYRSLFDDDGKAGKAVLLVEDFPNIFLWKPKTFYEFLDKYSEIGKSPIIFICTDDQNLNMSNDLFPSSIKTKHNITEIKFNPVNQSSLMRTLKKVAGTWKEKKKSVSVDTLQSIAHGSNGDLRNALSNLNILITSSNSAKRNKTNEKSTDLLSIKDGKTDFYQSLGRVLYPKKMAGNLRDGSKRIFLHDINEISSNFGDSFFMLLHENYIGTFGDLESVTEATNVFSICDAFLNEIELREYAGLIAVAGLMISNKKPKRDGFKPIKKSGAPPSLVKDAWFKRFEYSSYNETLKNLNLDIIPYIKKLNGLGKSDRDGSETEDIEIGEFDD